MKFCYPTFALALLFLLSSGCGTTPAQNTPPTADTAPIHTQVAATFYAAAAPSPTVTLTPASAEIAIVSAPNTPQPTQTESPTATPAVITVPTMENVPLLQGVGSYGLRVLEQPAAVVRDGITLQVEQVVVYPDSIELVYTIRDIPHTSLFDPFTTPTEDICGGPDSYANLMLPNGEIIYAENYLLDGKAFGTIQGPTAYSFLIHIYRAAVPAEVREMTLVLKCLELAELDKAPLNWEVPFRVAPAGEKTN